MENNYIFFEDNKQHYMVIDKNNKNMRWKKKVFLNLKQFDLNNLPIIYEYDLKNKNIKEITKEYLNNNEIVNFEKDNVVEVIEEIKGSNSKIFAGTNNTKLDQNMIEKMKKENDSNDIIKTIIDNNENYKNRTQFSKEKYINKKINKYKNIFIFQKPNIFLINKYFFYSKSYEYYPIGLNSLGCILQNTDINNDHHILLNEKTKGCLLSLILEDIEEGSSNIISLTHKDLKISNFQCVKYLNYENLFEKYCKVIEKDEKDFYDIIIICSDYNPISIIESVKTKINTGCKIICFKNNIDELNDFSKYLFDSKMFIDVNIIELFSRTMQILPLRCHPEMLSKTNQGFLLTCYKIN